MTRITPLVFHLVSINLFNGKSSAWKINSTYYVCSTNSSGWNRHQRCPAHFIWAQIFNLANNKNQRPRIFGLQFFLVLRGTIVSYSDSVFETYRSTCVNLWCESSRWHTDLTAGQWVGFCFTLLGEGRRRGPLCHSETSALLYSWDPLWTPLAPHQQTDHLYAWPITPHQTFSGADCHVYVFI